MTPQDEADAHVGKAQEFLTAAQTSLELGLFNAASSNAVICGVNAKDAICLALTGRTAKTENHDTAIAELKAAGRAGRGLAPTLSRLMRLRPKSQYQAASIPRSDAVRAVQWAQRMLDGAKRVVTA